jgi:hypothetical protein
MFILRKKTSSEDAVVFGPIYWDKQLFQNKLYKMFNIEFALPYQNPTEKVFNITEELSIWPVNRAGDPEVNFKTEYLDGPFWDYDETHATEYYVRREKEMPRAKKDAKTYFAEMRWYAEERGVVVEINSNNYLIPTDRESRSNIYNAVAGNWKLKRIDDENITLIEKIGLGNRKRDWETGPRVSINLDDEWVTLTEENVQTIKNAISAHVQMCYDWEQGQHNDVDACQTLQDIEALPPTL